MRAVHVALVVAALVAAYNIATVALHTLTAHHDVGDGWHTTAPPHSHEERIVDLGGGKTELRTEGSSKAHPPREANEEPEPVRSMVENHQLGLPRRHGLFHSLHGREYLRQPVADPKVYGAGTPPRPLDAVSRARERPAAIDRPTTSFMHGASSEPATSTVTASEVLLPSPSPPMTQPLPLLHSSEINAAIAEGRARGEAGPRKFHVVITANDAVYQEWQSLIMYWWYQRVKRENPDCDMGGFTRVLHAWKPDGLMDKLPTMLVNPLPRGQDQGYVVLNRPFALMQFMEQAQIKEDYILMAEPDHLMLKPIPNLATPDKPAAFPFFYINTKDKNLGRVANRFNTKANAIDPIGNSPVIIHKEMFAPLVSEWHSLALKMKRDGEASKVFGWVLEMWAYAIASAQANVQHSLHTEFMAQPPYDQEFQDAKSKKDFLILHYTYGQDFDLSGRFMPGKIGKWRFDKRQFMSKYPPRNYPMPPKSTPRMVVKLVEMVNEATANMSWWPTSAGQASSHLG